MNESSTHRVLSCIFAGIIASSCGAKTPLGEPLAPVTDVPTEPPRGCDFEPTGPVVRLDTPALSQLDDMIFQPREQALTVAWLRDENPQNFATRLQSFSLSGQARRPDTAAFTADPPRSLARVALARSRVGYLVAGLLGTSTLAEYVSADETHTRTALNESDSLVNAVATPDGSTHILTVNTGAMQRLRVHNFAVDSLIVRNTNEIVYANAAGPSVAIAPANNDGLVATWAEGIVGPTCRIHAARLVGPAQESEQILDSFETAHRSTVYAAGGPRGAWVFWTNTLGELWGASLRSNEQSFRPRVRIAEHLAASEAAAVMQQGSTVVIVAKEMQQNGDAPVNLRMIVINEQSGGVQLDTLVDRTISPFRVAITSHDERTFTVGWTAALDPLGADVRIFIRTYGSPCP